MATTRLKKVLVLTLMLSVASVFFAQAQKLEVISGSITSVMPSVTEGKYDILLRLDNRPETFVVTMNDAPKFGLTKSVTVSSGPEFLQMIDDMQAVIGWKVNLTCVKTGNPQRAEYLVKSLEKISAK